MLVEPGWNTGAPQAGQNFAPARTGLPHWMHAIVSI